MEKSFSLPNNNSSSLIASDASRYLDFEIPNIPNKFKVFWLFFNFRDYRVVYIYRKRHEHRIKGHKLRRYLWTLLNDISNNAAYIDEDADIGPKFRIVHALEYLLEQSKLEAIVL